MAIPAFGWRVSYMAVGIVSTALVLPISLFILRYKPEEMGLRPYGAEDVEQRAVSGASAPASGENGITLKELLRQPEFYIGRGVATGPRVMRVPEFLPDALWDRSRTYAAGGGHDDEYFPSETCS